jgi:hypothetical protein
MIGNEAETHLSRCDNDLLKHAEDQLLIQSTPRGLSIGVRSRSKAGWRERRIERHGGDAIVGVEL